MRFSNFLVSLLTACLFSTASAETYDWTSTSSGVYQIQFMGNYDDGQVAGRLFRKTVNRTAFSYINAPLTPLPANLNHLQSYGEYVLNTANQVVWRGALYATLWNDSGDALYATGHTVATNGSNYSNSYLFTGGAGLFSGATGWWDTSGTVLSNSTQSWNSVAHLELPAQVPEPAMPVVLMMAVGILGLTLRRKRSA